MRECTTGNTACLNDLELGAPCHVVARLLYVIIRLSGAQQGQYCSSE